jgi:hypothetical protein
MRLVRAPLMMRPLEDRVRSAGRRPQALTIRWGDHPVEPRPTAITERDLDVLDALAEHRYLTTSMLTMLFWGADTYAPRRRLKQLHDAWLLERFRPSVLRSDGSHEWIYRLVERGSEVLSGARPGAPSQSRSELHYIGYVDHDLQLAALVLEIGMAAAPGAGPLAPRLPFRWHGVERGRVDPAWEHRHEEASEGAQLPQGWTMRQGASRLGVVEPDATLIGRAATHGGELAVLLEYDRTRRAHRQADRFARYDRFLAEGWRLSRYARLAHEPIVVFICSGEAQLPSFVREADRCLTAWVGPPEAGPGEGLYPGREQIAFTSYERLSAGNWRMLQVPAKPSALSSAQLEPRQIDVPLPELFVPPA